MSPLQSSVLLKLLVNGDTRNALETHLIDTITIATSESLVESMQRSRITAVYWLTYYIAELPIYHSVSGLRSK